MNLAAIALSLGGQKANADKTAFFTTRGAVSNERIQRLVFSYANGLEALGLKPGDKILLRMTNSVEFAASFLATVWLGGIPVLQNSQFGRSELEYIVGLTRPTGIILLGPRPDPSTD